MYLFTKSLSTIGKCYFNSNATIDFAGIVTIKSLPSFWGPSKFLINTLAAESKSLKSVNEIVYSIFGTVESIENSSFMKQNQTNALLNGTSLEIKKYLMETLKLTEMEDIKNDIVVFCHDDLEFDIFMKQMVELALDTGGDIFSQIKYLYFHSLHLFYQKQLQEPPIVLREQ